MKILHINSYYGGNSFYKNFYDKQKENGLDLAVYVPVSANIDISAINLGDYTTISKNHSKYDRMVFNIKHKKIYNDIIKKYDLNEFSIIHAHSLFSNGYIALKLKKNFGKPYVVAVRNTDVNIFFKYLIYLRKLGIEIFKEAEKVIFLSPSYRDLVIEKYLPPKLKKEIFNKTQVIPNGIDDFWFRNKNNLKNCPRQNDLQLIYIGAINRNKNIITTVQTVKILQQKGYKIKFTVVGRIENKSIYKQIKNLPFLNYVKSKPKEELINVYRTNDIFVMPSINETFGLVYAEAMSQGLPVIYSKGQGFDGQFLDGKVGYHVDCFNAQEIADRVVYVINNYRILSENCVRLCDKFNWNNIFEDYKKIYLDVCCE